MPIELDHLIVSSRDRVAGARRLATLLGVPYAESDGGHFSPVYVNAGLTLDFIQTDSDFPEQHLCFRVGPQEFEAILGRLRAEGVPHRSSPRGPWDSKVNERLGNVYWSEPDGHSWEILQVSYARPKG